LSERIKERKEGFLHLLRSSGKAKGAQYSLVFTPTTGAGFVPSRSFTSLDELKSFLNTELGLRLGAVEEALDELRQTGASSLYPIILTTQRAKTLGLN
jgi:hypothetical protein